MAPLKPNSLYLDYCSPSVLKGTDLLIQPSGDDQPAEGMYRNFGSVQFHVYPTELSVILLLKCCDTTKGSYSGNPAVLNAFSNRLASSGFPKPNIIRRVEKLSLGMFSR
jgi:hypothetical protein